METIKRSATQTAGEHTEYTLDGHTLKIYTGKQRTGKGSARKRPAAYYDNKLLAILKARPGETIGDFRMRAMVEFGKCIVHSDRLRERDAQADRAAAGDRKRLSL